MLDTYEWVQITDGVTLDRGAGFCRFISNIESQTKIAVGINEDSLGRFAAKDVRCVIASVVHLNQILQRPVDRVLASNPYEQFPSREDVAAGFGEVHRVLRPGGRFLVLRANFRYCVRSHFGFFDHRLIFTHLGRIEGLRICGFDMERFGPRFLPSASKSRLRAWPSLVWLYLRFPAAWRLFGAQMLLVASKEGA